MPALVFKIERALDSVVLDIIVRKVALRNKRYRVLLEGLELSRALLMRRVVAPVTAGFIALWVVPMKKRCLAVVLVCIVPQVLLLLME